MQMFGRTVIYTDVASVTAGNVREVLPKTLLVHHKNRSEIESLPVYFKDKSHIPNKKKGVRPAINRKICEKRANEIVLFRHIIKFRMQRRIRTEIVRCRKLDEMISEKQRKEMNRFRFTI